MLTKGNCSSEFGVVDVYGRLSFIPLSCDNKLERLSLIIDIPVALLTPIILPLLTDSAFEPNMSGFLA